MLLAILVVILVMANNFFYYQSRDDLSLSALKNIFKAISGQYEACLNSSMGPDQCRENLKNGLYHSWSYGRITVVDKNGAIFFEKDQENYGEDRNVVLFKGSAGGEANQLDFVLTKRSSPPLWKSTFRSIFFSVWEFWGQNDKINFFWNVAFKRSSPLFYSVLTISLLLFLIRLSDQQKKKIYNKIETDNFIFGNDLEATRTKLKQQLDRQKLMEEQIKNLKEDEDKLLKDYYRQKDQLQAEISESQSRENSLLVQLEESAKVLKKIKPTKTDDDSQSLYELFLNNPIVKLRDEVFDYNIGDHHSKNFVKEMAIGLGKDEISSRLITKVNHEVYGPGQKGIALLKWNDKKNIFVLNLYEHDTGYAAEVVLNNNAAESAYIAKYLLSGKQFLAKRGFKLKIGLLS